MARGSVPAPLTLGSSLVDQSQEQLSFKSIQTPHRQNAPSIRLIHATPRSTGPLTDGPLDSDMGLSNILTNADNSIANSSWAAVPFDVPQALPSTSVLAPKEERNASRKRLVLKQKKSKLSLLVPHSKNTDSQLPPTSLRGSSSRADFSDVARRIGITSGSASGFDIYVDHSGPNDDANAGEVVMVKKKKSRAGLNGFQWGAMGEITNIPAVPNEDSKPKGSSKETKEGSGRWWAIGRGRKDSKDTERNENIRPRSKSPGPVEQFKKVASKRDRSRFNSFDSGLLLNSSSTQRSAAADAPPAMQRSTSVSNVLQIISTSGMRQGAISTDRDMLDLSQSLSVAGTDIPKDTIPSRSLTPTFVRDVCSIDTIGVRPSEPGPSSAPPMENGFLAPPMEDGFLAPPTSGSHPRNAAQNSIAQRAMRSVRSLARIGSWAQMRNTTTINHDDDVPSSADIKPTAHKSKKDAETTTKTASKKRAALSSNAFSTVRSSSGSSFEAGYLSPSPTKEPAIRTSTLGRRKASVLGLGLPSTVRNPREASSSRAKTSFKKARLIKPLHTGGPVSLTPDGQHIVTCIGEEAILTDISSGTEVCRFSGDTEDITTLCISQSSKYLLSFTLSLSLRIYELPSLPSLTLGVIQPTNVVGRAHDAPVHVCKTDPTSTYLASGSADGVVKIWDIAKGHITHVFKGHGGVVSALAFNFPRNPDSVVRDYKMQLVTASVDTRVRIFNLVSQGPDKSKPEAVLEGHVSVPRALDVTPDGKWLISSGRDSVALIWDLSSQAKSADKKGKGKLVSPSLVTTVPILERVEAAGFLHAENESGKLLFYTAGEKGAVKIWDARQGKAIHQLGHERLTTDEEQEEQRQILDASYHAPTSTIISVHADQNILFHSVRTHGLIRQLIGYNDEIVDAAFLSSTISTPDSHIAFATNSSLIRVYSMSSLDSRLLEGHSEIVLSLDRSASKSVIASGSKDKTARLWAPLVGGSAGADANNWGWGCVAVCEGHAESVGALAMSRTGEPFMFTGSQDRTIKMWDLSQVPDQWSGDDDASSSLAVVRCQSLTTLKAHDKDINSLDIAPNDRLLASGSQDRTAKVFEIIHHDGAGVASRGEIRLLGTCTGHKRGVWSVRFGRAERVLATGGGDKTVRLWNLDDFSCVKTFEGHTNSVLRVDFISQGMQLISAASDGLVKLWNVREEVCVATLDNHEDKIWALAVSSDEQTIVSGAADSIITFWEDCTEEEELEKESKRAETALREQDFMNYLALHDYRRAIELALAMDQPGRLFSLFRDVVSKAAASGAQAGSSVETIIGHPAVDQVIRELSEPDLAKLLLHIRTWNTQAKSSEVAQNVLFAIIKLRSVDDIMQAFNHDSTLTADARSKNQGGLKDLLDALIPYTERHLARMEKLVQESYVVDYILGEMDDGMLEDEISDDARDGMDVETVLAVDAR